MVRYYELCRYISIYAAILFAKVKVIYGIYKLWYNK